MSTTLRDVGSAIARAANAAIDTSIGDASGWLMQAAFYAIGAALLCALLAAIVAAHRNQSLASDRVCARIDADGTP